MGILLNSIKISLALTPVILLFLLVSPLLGKRYGARLRCFIWLAFAIRLLIPFSAPFEIRLPIQQPEVWFTSPVWGTHLEESVMPIENESETKRPEPIKISPQKMMVTIWAAGAGLFLLYHLGAYIHLRRNRRRWGTELYNGEIHRELMTIKWELSIAQNVRIYRSAKAASPMLIGFLRPCVILPHTISYDDPRLALMLRHELMHLKRGDLWYKLIMLLANAAHWYNPLVWVLAMQMGFDTELACDTDVLAGTGQDQRRAYGYTVLSLIEQRWRCNTPLTSRFIGGKLHMKRRILNITDTSVKKRGVVLLFAMVLVIALAGSAVYGAEDIPATPAVPTTDEEFIWPLKGEFRVTANRYSYQGHTGIDIKPKKVKSATPATVEYEKTPVYASKSGTVIRAKTNGMGYGKYLIIDHGDGYVTYYAHNSELLVDIDDIVEQGQKIAYTGSTGNAYGEHLHFEVRQNGTILDPEAHLPELDT